MKSHCSAWLCAGARKASSCTLSSQERVGSKLIKRLTTRVNQLSNTLWRPPCSCSTLVRSSSVYFSADAFRASPEINTVACSVIAHDKRETDCPVKSDNAFGSYPRAGNPRGLLFSLAAQPRSDAAVDLDDRRQVVRLRRGHQGKDLAHDEYADIGDVLADRNRQLVFVAHHRVDEHGPEPAIVHHRFAEVRRRIAPGVMRRLQFGGGFEEQARFQFARICYFLGDCRVGFAGVMHGQGA